MDRKRTRKLKEGILKLTCQLATVTALAILVLMLCHVASEGIGWLSFDFLTNFPSRHAEKAGLKSALFGTLWVISITAVLTIPLGVATAMYLVEYSRKNRFVNILQLNISNLAGMPSIVYGLLGLTIFVRLFAFERSVLSGALTLTLLTLPVVIIASQEALRAVPEDIRLAAYALGALRWQVCFLQVLPAALPGIMTGVILAISRAIGESAPLIMIGALSYVAFVPASMNDSFTVLPVQIFSWASRPQEAFHGLAAAAILVLLTILLVMNFTAAYIRQKFQRFNP
jgi:phosphate transport system permease protein